MNAANKRRDKRPTFVKTKNTDMRRLLSYLLFLSPFLAFTQTDISGVINHYASVSDIDYCTGTITTAQPPTFANGDTLLLIQMQGATIQTPNNMQFGAIMDLKQTGRYERVVVADVSGNTITLAFALLNEYDLPDGIVQLVDMPYYASAIVTDSLRAQAWDGTTGGILAFSAGQLTLNAPIDVSGQGFRGGDPESTEENNCTFLFGQNDYSYPAGSWRAGGKGEGIALYITGEEAGRGPQANGGGGGNDHNAGGGGGGHAAPGGQGGTNEEPATFGCQGNFPGLGGRALPLDPSRVYMGGGGGAGHENNDATPFGGNGGGIVFLNLDQITTNAFPVNARGADSPDGSGDGTSGAGAGGTIWVNYNSASGEIILDASGGDGGNNNNSNQEWCRGPGGGGAGGRVMVSTSGPIQHTPITDGGENGISFNSASCNDSPNGAESGMNGIIEAAPEIPTGTEVNSAPMIALPADNYTLCVGADTLIEATVSGAELSYQWQIFNGVDYTPLSNNSTFSGTQTPTLNITNAEATLNGAQIRLVVSSDCFGMVTGEALDLNIISTPMAAFNSSLDVFTLTLTNMSQDADQVSWDFGDGQSSDALSPIHTFAGPGTYNVVLTASNACGTDTANELIIIQTAAPEVTFSSDLSNGCPPLNIQFTDNSSGSIDSIRWEFPGGNPASSTLAMPYVTYNAPGTYNVTLTAYGPGGTVSETEAGFVTVSPLPDPGFSLTQNGNSFNFTNTSLNATSYVWDFGDTNTSMDTNPEHTYTGDGNFQVTLTATNACGSETSSQTVEVLPPLVADFTSGPSSSCAPLVVQFTDASIGMADSLRWDFPGGTPTTSTIAMPEVAYNTAGNYDVSLTVFGPTGPVTTTQTDYVQVFQPPVPAFTVFQDGPFIEIMNNSQASSSYNWNFGDGTTSSAENPTHTYTESGLYTITLNAQNGNCGRTITQLVNIVITATEEASLEQVQLFPNPTDGVIQLISEQPVQVHAVYSSQGRLVASPKMDAAMRQLLDLRHVPAGMYWIGLEIDGQIGYRRVIVE